MVSFSPEAFGRYYLIDKIAVGGMAEVFKAKTFSHGGFEKLLVIKRILEHLSDNDEFVDMFIDEAKISVELQHPNVIQIFDFGRIQENYFIAMECVEGKDIKGILRKLAERRKLIPTEFAVYVAHEICKGLDYAHKRTDMQGSPLGIIHRDVSPSNILVSYGGEIKIADFGIAKARISGYNTRDGVLKGKFEYMSPEQASGLDIGPRADVFSTGIILHEMLTGRRLFKTDSDIKTLEKIKAVDIQPPSALNPAIPARLDVIVMKALSVQPSARYEDAKALQNALLEFLYPATPDLTRDNLGHFMTELFSAEIRDERSRLESGTRTATSMYEQAPELDLNQEWVEAPSSAQTMQLRPSRTPLLVAVIGVLLMMLGVAWFSLQRPVEPLVVERIVEVKAPVPVLGSLHIKVSPEVEARVYLNGELLGIGPDHIRSDLPPETAFEIKVEADGYQVVRQSHTVGAGERLRLPIRLSRIRVPSQAPAPSATPATAPAAAVALPPPPEPASPGKLSVNVRGGWAEVYVDGKRVDTTPLYNHSLPAGRHAIQIVNGATGERKTRNVTIIPGETTRVTF